MAFSRDEKARCGGLGSVLVIGGVAGGINDPPTAIDVPTNAQRTVDDDVADKADRSSLERDGIIANLHGAGANLDTDGAAG
ncbi:hypothetical protein D3C81_1966660 [compost metagenome]